MNLKAFNRAVDRFCHKHPRFGIPKLMLYVVILSAAVFILDKMDRTGQLVNFLYFNPALILRGQVWRLITFIFLPTSYQILWLVITLYFYYFIGNSLEQYWGAAKFTVYYLCGILLTIIFGFIIHFLGFTVSTYLFTSYYLNMSMFFAFAALFPDVRVLLFFFVPVKVKWLAYIDAAFFIVEIVTNFAVFPLNLLPVIAIINFLLFFWDVLWKRIKRSGVYASPQVINFRKAAREEKQKQENAPYRHKCSVCGRTDTDHPELEFRYCSKCAGYHCFCEDHINNHVHFNE